MIEENTVLTEARSRGAGEKRSEFCICIGLALLFLADRYIYLSYLFLSATEIQ